MIQRFQSFRICLDLKFLATCRYRHRLVRLHMISGQFTNCPLKRWVFSTILESGLTTHNLILFSINILSTTGPFRNKRVICSEWVITNSIQRPNPLGNGLLLSGPFNYVVPFLPSGFNVYINDSNNIEAMQVARYALPKKSWSSRSLAVRGSYWTFCWLPDITAECQLHLQNSHIFGVWVQCRKPGQIPFFWRLLRVYSETKLGYNGICPITQGYNEDYINRG